MVRYRYVSKRYEIGMKGGFYQMTEKELRAKVIAVAESYKGYTEANGGDDKIIDKYNAIRPVGGYKMNHDDSWCAAFASVCGHEAGLSSIIPVECSCERMINLFKKLGRWQEDGTVMPQPGDYIFYDWDSKKQPTDGWADHVGIIKSVTDKYITAIEGNNSDAVRERKIAVGSAFIRGFGLPDYASVAKVESKPAEAKPAEVKSTESSSYKVKVTASALNIRSDAGKEYKVVGLIKDQGVYTIVGEKKATDGGLWGKLKSGAGWISLAYTKKF